MGSNGLNYSTEVNERAVIVEKPTKRRKNDHDSFDYAEIEKMLPEQFDELYEKLPLTEDTTCGLWIFKGDLLQKWVEIRCHKILWKIKQWERKRS